MPDGRVDFFLEEELLLDDLLEDLLDALLEDLLDGLLDDLLDGLLEDLLDELDFFAFVDFLVVDFGFVAELFLLLVVFLVTFGFGLVFGLVAV